MGQCGNVQCAARSHDAAAAGVPVLVNVYDLQVDATLNSRLGFGFYHSGIQVFNAEYSFGGDGTGKGSTGTGIFAAVPKTALPANQFCAQYLAGYLPPGTSHADVIAVLREMKPEWSMLSYHLVQKNCNHFAAAFLDALTLRFGLEKPLDMPVYVNRAARFGEALAPPSVLKLLTSSVGMQQPPTAPSTYASGPSSPATMPSRRGSYYSFPAGPLDELPPQSPRQRNSPVKVRRTRRELEQLPVRDLKTIMLQHRIEWTPCSEKHELVEQILAVSGSDDDHAVVG